MLNSLHTLRRLKGISRLQNLFLRTTCFKRWFCSVKVKLFLCLIRHKAQVSTTRSYSRHLEGELLASCSTGFNPEESTTLLLSTFDTFNLLQRIKLAQAVTLLTFMRLSAWFETPPWHGPPGLRICMVYFSSLTQTPDLKLKLHQDSFLNTVVTIHY